jgi:NADH dehydrogenase [ubiquinone] 1 alpha subcomplex assembly factor 7
MFQLVDSEVNNKNVKNILNPHISFEEEAKNQIQVGDRIEVQPKSMILMNSFAELISKVGGGVLSIDYGEDHAFSDSIRGISNHKYVEKLEDLLEVPGEADISAYVNFMALADVAEDVSGVEAFQTVTQGDFLNMLGIQQRAEVLKQSPGVDAALLDSQVERLTDFD